MLLLRMFTATARWVLRRRRQSFGGDKGVIAPFQFPTTAVFVECGVWSYQNQNCSLTSHFTLHTQLFTLHTKNSTLHTPNSTRSQRFRLLTGQPLQVGLSSKTKRPAFDQFVTIKSKAGLFTGEILVLIFPYFEHHGNNVLIYKK
jgi:hypothetical protein